MPRRDLYHDLVINALINDGWIITDDPLILKLAERTLQVDLGAEYRIEYPIGAEKANRKIAIEIKSFLGDSEVHDLQLAIGQYVMYREMLLELEPERDLYLAIPKYSFDGIFSEQFGQIMIERQRLKLLVYDDQEETIIRWL